jgi:hypothetical protein
LALELRRQAQFAERNLPPHLAGSIAEARGEIARIKRRLREWQAPIDDRPDDSAESS